MAKPPHVIVVGAGIIGASIALHLARAGARVTVLDAGELGGIATRASWAWLNASWGNPRAYFRLRLRAMAEWRRAERDVPGIRVAWVGGLLWDLPADQLRAYAAEHAAWGYPVRLVDGDAAQKIEPALANPPALAAHVASEGAVEALPATLAFLAAAQALGAEVIGGHRVIGIEVAGDRVTGVRTVAGPLAADEVVVAAGVRTPSLLRSAGVAVPLRHAPGLLVDSAPGDRVLNGLLIAPGMELRQTADGRLLAAADIDDAGLGDGGRKRAREVFDAMRAMLRDGKKFAFGSHTIGYRPMPEDGLPYVGRSAGLAGLYVAVTHSGVTLAPALGAFVAEEILNGNRDALLAPYTLDRAIQREAAQ